MSRLTLHSRRDVDAPQVDGRRIYQLKAELIGEVARKRECRSIRENPAICGRAPPSPRYDWTSAIDLMKRLSRLSRVE